jgi:hypothetical protein
VLPTDMMLLVEVLGEIDSVLLDAEETLPYEPFVPVLGETLLPKLVLLAVVSDLDTEDSLDALVTDVAEDEFVTEAELDNLVGESTLVRVDELIRVCGPEDTGGGLDAVDLDRIVSGIAMDALVKVVELAK